MYPEIWSYPHISSYSFFWLAAFLAGYLIASWGAKRREIGRFHIDNVVILLLLAVPIGARWFSRLFYMPEVSMLESFKLWSGGGLVFYGGFLIGMASVVAYALLRGVNVVHLLDVMAPAAAIGLAVGRVGCFLGGCCWGDLCVEPARLAGLEPEQRKQVQTVAALSSAEWPIQVEFPARSAAFKQHRQLGLVGDGAPRSMAVHPVQLYEAALVFGLAIGLARLVRKRNPGETVIALAIGYAIIRFGTEFLRADNPAAYSGLTLSQAISAGILLVGGVAWWGVIRRRIVIERRLCQSSEGPLLAQAFCEAGNSDKRMQAANLPKRPD